MRIQRVLVSHGSEFRLVGELDHSSCRQLQRMLAGPASDGGVVTLDLSAEIASGALLLRSATDDVLQTFKGSDALAKLHVKPGE